MVAINYTYIAQVTYLYFYIDGVLFQQILGNLTYLATPQFTVVVQPGSTYMLDRDASTPRGSITTWWELR